METNENPDKQKKISLITCALVVLLACAALLWRSAFHERPPSDISPTDPTVSTKGPEASLPSVTDASVGEDPSVSEPPGESQPPGTVQTDPTEVPGVKPTDPVPSVSDPADPTVTTEPTASQTDRDKLSVDKIAKFSGIFIEDGSDEPIEDVAALLVTNRSERYLDIATIGYLIDGKKATFIVTGLPPGTSCWVMEYTGITVTEGADFQYEGSNTSFRDDVLTATEDVTIRSDGDRLYATNETDRTLENVFIYYKTLHTDGSYFGGITYMVEFGTLEPGQTADKIGGHFTKDGSRIVRIGWQEQQAEELS